MKKKDIYRPIFGLFCLQPPTVLWSYLNDIPYWSNLGLFSLITTVYLMPVYAWFERKYDMVEKDFQSVGWPY